MMRKDTYNREKSKYSGHFFAVQELITIFAAEYKKKGQRKWIMLLQSLPRGKYW